MEWLSGFFFWGGWGEDEKKPGNGVVFLGSKVAVNSPTELKKKWGWRLLGQRAMYKEIGL